MRTAPGGEATPSGPLGIEPGRSGSDGVTKPAKAIGARMEFAGSGGNPAEDQLALPVTEARYFSGEAGAELGVHVSEGQRMKRSILELVWPTRKRMRGHESCWAADQGCQRRRGTQGEKTAANNHAMHDFDCSFCVIPAMSHAATAKVATPIPA